MLSKTQNTIGYIPFFSLFEFQIRLKCALTRTNTHIYAINHNQVVPWHQEIFLKPAKPMKEATWKEVGLPIQDSIQQQQQLRHHHHHHYPQQQQHPKILHHHRIHLFHLYHQRQQAVVM